MKGCSEVTQWGFELVSLIDFCASYMIEYCPCVSVETTQFADFYWQLWSVTYLQ